METLRQLHTSVAQGFEASFGAAYRHLSDQLAAQDARVKAAEDEARIANEERTKSAVKVKTLEDDISVLREEIRQYETDAQECETSATDPDEMEERYAPREFMKLVEAGSNGRSLDILQLGLILSFKYTELYEEFQDAIEVSSKLRSRVKRHKEKLMRYLNFMDRDNFTIVRDGHPVKFQKIRTASDGHQIQSEPRLPGVESPGDGSTANLASRDIMDSTQSVSGPLDTSVRSNRLQYGNAPEHLSTPSVHSAWSNEVDSNDPTPSTTRPPNQRRPLPSSLSASFHGHENNRPERPVIIKSESVPSSPVRRLSQCAGPPGTQDLDDIGNTVQTPRKLKDASSAVGNQPHPADMAQRMAPDGQRDAVLAPRPTDGNGNVSTAHPPNRRTRAGRKRDFNRMVQQDLPSVAEDGDDSHPEAGGRKRRQRLSENPRSEQPNSDASTSSTQGRLQNLLEKPTTPRPPLNLEEKPREIAASGRRSLRRLKHRNNHDHGASHSHPSLEPRDLLERNDAQANTAVGFSSGTEKPEGERTAVTPDDEPYRARPLHRLDLGHFKINQDYNQGLNFAYDSSLRKKGERKCAPNCTRKDCCGDKFRAMARVGGLPPQLSKSLQEGDLRRLQDGSEDGHRGEDDMAREIASRYGKHRHNHQRSRTPPGFWRSDMPTTQDLELDREEARKLEREKVAERHREALRPGGVWRFADE